MTSEDTSPIQHRGAGEEPSLIAPGTVLANRYRVERVLGSGGMGIVVAATHMELGQRVALKFLLPAASYNPELVARFLREARAAVQIESEHVARVTDVGRLENDAPYMVMEYLEGTDLAGYPRDPPVAPELAVEFVLQACEAIAVAHSLGIVHRDLKPANLFLTTRPDGSPLVKVLDFGISKLLENPEGHVDLTRTAALLGSPLYMSPEQIESSRSVDARTDIWALGTILYDLLTGQPPFLGETVGAVFAAVLKAPTPPLRAKRPDVPEALERVVLRALEKDVSQRFADVAELAQALAEFAPPHARLSVDRVCGVLRRSGSLRPAAALSAPPPADGGTGTNWEDSAVRKAAASRSRARWVGMAAGALLIGGAALFWRTSHRDDNAATPAATPPEPAAAATAAVKPAVPMPTTVKAVATAAPSTTVATSAPPTVHPPIAHGPAPGAGRGVPSAIAKGDLVTSAGSANPLHVKFK